MSISSEKLYTTPGSEEELELQEEQQRVRRRRNNTGAKKGKGKKVALTILLLGGLTAGVIFGTKAVHSIQETKRVDTLISSYTTENYVSLPNTIVTDRAYDTTFADGKKVVSRLEDKNVDYININGQFYTREGIPVMVVTYEVTYKVYEPTIVTTNEGTQFYMPPVGYGFHDASWRGEEAYKYDVQTRTVVVPADLDLNSVRFPGAEEFHIVGEPIVLNTLPYEVIENSTLICDVPDNATLNENNECMGTLDLAPKKR